jgi:hypothetical protein
MRAPDGRLRAICTDKGQHPRRLLGYLWAEGESVMFRKWVKPPADRTVPLLRMIDGVMTGTLPLQCPTCPRNVPLRQETARRLLDTCLPAGANTIDISNIP